MLLGVRHHHREKSPAWFAFSQASRSRNREANRYFSEAVTPKRSHRGIRTSKCLNPATCSAEQVAGFRQAT